MIADEHQRRQYSGALNQLIVQQPNHGPHMRRLQSEQFQLVKNSLQRQAPEENKVEPVERNHQQEAFRNAQEIISDSNSDHLSLTEELEEGEQMLFPNIETYSREMTVISVQRLEATPGFFKLDMADPMVEQLNLVAIDIIRKQKEARHIKPGKK